MKPTHKHVTGKALFLREHMFMSNVYLLLILTRETERKELDVLH